MLICTEPKVNASADGTNNSASDATRRTASFYTTTKWHVTSLCSSTVFSSLCTHKYSVCPCSALWRPVTPLRKETWCGIEIGRTLERLRKAAEVYGKVTLVLERQLLATVGNRRWKSGHVVQRKLNPSRVPSETTCADYLNRRIEPGYWLASHLRGLGSIRG